MIVLDASECFITTVDFASHLKLLPTVQHSIASEAVAFSLHLAGHLAGTLGPMPISNRQFADVLDMLFDEVLKAEVLWNQARVRAAWMTGLRSALADGHPNNRHWLSVHGKHLSTCSIILIVIDFCNTSLFVTAELLVYYRRACAQRSRAGIAFTQ